MSVALILPTQLFKKPIINSGKIYLYEHPSCFTKYNYHKNKLVLHRSSMKYYVDFLQGKNIQTKYINFYESIEPIFERESKLIIYDSIDHDIRREFNKLSKKYNTELIIYDTPLFLNTYEDLQEYIEQHEHAFIHSNFYKYQRIRLNLFIDKNDKPLFGKWSFDKDNRKPFPKDFDIDFNPKPVNNEYITEAIEYVENNFANNFGEINFFLPITHKDARKHFNNFLKTKLEYFGPYEDAVDENIFSGTHSLLSPLLNIGLITPEEIIEEIRYYKFNGSVEAFVRQIIGWREYMRMFYEFKYDTIKLNHFNHHKKITKDWYNGTTGLLPCDVIINKVIKYGYAHHIERLMYLSAPMLLHEFSPKQIHDWFMMFIDAYPWVMPGNVYAMGQFATGPIITKRPYFSSSNYIIKMSSYKKGEWSQEWDDLYYAFIKKHAKEFSKIYSLARSVAYIKNK